MYAKMQSQITITIIEKIGSRVSCWTEIVSINFQNRSVMHFRRNMNEHDNAFHIMFKCPMYTLQRKQFHLLPIINSNKSNTINVTSILHKFSPPITKTLYNFLLNFLKARLFL